MEKLFEEFDSVSLKEWVDQITRDLKGKSLEVLNSKPEHDLEIKAYHHREELSPTSVNVAKTSNNWSIRKVYAVEKNATILDDLNKGVDAVGFVYSDNFFDQTKDVLFEHLCTDIQFKRDFEGDIARLNGTAKLNFDLIAQEIEDGSWFSTKEIFIDYFKKTKSFSNLWISGNVYGDAGATTIQELAFTLAHLNEYVDMLVNSGESLATINKNLSIELSVTENYFVNIAKMRVIRTLVRALFEAYDAKHIHLPITLYAKTAQRHLAVNDSNSNLLRQTTQAMSAVLGGCDVLTVQTLKTGDAVQDAIHERMAKNIQLVLKEEAYLDKVVDPSAGSYYLESLSSQLLTSAWDKFKEIEKLGGFGDCIQNNSIQDQIEENKAYLIEQLNSKKASFLGVNKHPSALETWKNQEAPSISTTKTFKAIVPFRLESHYTQNVTA